VTLVILHLLLFYYNRWFIRTGRSKERIGDGRRGYERRGKRGEMRRVIRGEGGEERREQW
jgi:hypothetical protein